MGGGTRAVDAEGAAAVEEQEWTEEELDEVESALRHISGRRPTAVAGGKPSPAKFSGALLSRASGTGAERL